MALAALSLAVLGTTPAGAAVRSAAPSGAASAPSGAAVAADTLADIPKVAHFIPPTTTHVYYHSGRVLHANRTHLVFWQPRGSGLRFDRGYRALVERFLHDVAAASHSTSNVFGLTGQYTDDAGPAAYASRSGRSVLDTDPLPVNGCVEPPTGPLWTHCVNDSQLQAELEHVVRADRLPHGRNDVYFLLTPSGLASCLSSSPSSGCSVAGPPNGYCGYHGVTNDGTLLYAVIPYNAVPGHCESWKPRPNHSSADPALSVVSHELSEMITDPDDTAWYDNSGSEIGDICLTSYGHALGGSGHSRYNESINGGHYYLQEEWSNADSRCRPRAERDHVSFSIARRASGGSKVWLVGKGSDPEGAIVGYHWFFGDGYRAHGRTVSHRFRRNGSYRIRLRVTDDWDNWTFYARAVTVGGPA